MATGLIPANVADRLLEMTKFAIDSFAISVSVRRVSKTYTERLYYKSGGPSKATIADESRSRMYSTASCSAATVELVPTSADTSNSATNRRRILSEMRVSRTAGRPNKEEGSQPQRAES